MGRFPPRLAVSHCNGMSIAMGAQPELVIRWTERGGPPAVAPVGKGGFGTKLVRMGLDGTGQVKLDFAPTGLSVELRAPLDGLHRV
jgi:two-component sensor histidine kinase